ncbi:flippase-like domain-containing protein [Nocardioides guangzhouensis]|uniref:Flippase-like domain-containing protein n=1 Tax=Nocardioides guangzhouensis TaxID=2497878 RepID=A0A4Q4ZJU8_9ACTN|nr:lysylphosphatidylglycerol synthase transmembrane domain-containing protein [Nocardioides guangzhouensis]RYP88590.1 flippase-like domain-containing protein [Nocardioides guangzhouensis]
MSRVPWRSLRTAVAVGILGAVLWRTGSGPLVAGLGSVDPALLVLAVALTVPATVACAWRWRLVAGGLGVGVALGPAVASCYRAQFLNTTLPGGVLGDVHRGVRHGRDAGDTGRGLRAVAWERLSGQVVLGAIALLVLVLLPSPVRPAMPLVLTGLVAAGVAGCVAGGVVVLLVRRVRPAATAQRFLHTVRDELEGAHVVRRAWPGVVVASMVAAGVHLSTYLVAARAVGVAGSPATLLPVAVLVLLAAGLPVNVAGWGPREGMAAWVFGASGLGADQGVATAVAYGAMVLVANLPGAVVLLVAWSRRRREVAPA